MKTRRNGVLAILTGLIFLALFCMPRSPAIAAEPYKIGCIFSVTGPASFLGDPEKKSAIMLADQINKNGGINGHPIKLIIYDTEGDPTKAVLNINKLIFHDKVLAVIGPSRTPTTLAVIPIAQRAQIPLISCAAGIKITQPVKKWVFKTAQTDALAVAKIYSYMKEQNIKKIAIITVANAFGESGKNQLIKQAPKYGIEVVAKESFGPKDTDMTPQLTKIRATSAEAVVCWGTNPGPAVVAKNMKQLDMKIPLFQSHGVASPKFIELAGDAANGIILPTGKILVAKDISDRDPQKPVLLKYIKDYESRYKTHVSGFGGYAYDGLNLLAMAMGKAGADRSKIRDELERIKGYKGISGVFNFSPSDHNGLTMDAFVLVKIADGKWKIIK